MSTSLKVEVGKISNVMLFATTLALLLFSVWLISPVFAPKLVGSTTSLGLIIFSLITTWFGFNTATNRSFPLQVRRAWAFIALGSLSSAIADAIWFYYYYNLATSPSLSISDLFYLLTFPLILLGIEFTTRASVFSSL